MGAEPYAGGGDATPVGSRLALEFAKSTGANFVTPNALAAAKRRLARPEPHQMLSADRLWADLLSSMPLCFNFFGDLEGDAATAARCLRAWWPDAPRGDVTVRFEHSPGRRDPAFLGNKSAFDVAFETNAGDVAAIIGVETKYHEHALTEVAPKPFALGRYVEVTERSGVFADGWQRQLIGTNLQQIWLDHLLVLAMLQHPSGRWRWGRFVLVYPEENPSFASAAARYADLLCDRTTFEARTLSELLSAPSAVPEVTQDAFTARYMRQPDPVRRASEPAPRSERRPPR